MADNSSIPRLVVQLYTDQLGNGNAELATADNSGPSMAKQSIRVTLVCAKLPSIAWILGWFIEPWHDVVGFVLFGR